MAAPVRACRRRRRLAVAAVAVASGGGGRARPTDEASFLAVKGMGPGRYEKWGEEILAVFAGDG